jgi:hypothetical protein
VGSLIFRSLLEPLVSVINTNDSNMVAYICQEVPPLPHIHSLLATHPIRYILRLLVSLLLNAQHGASWKDAATVTYAPAFLTLDIVVPPVLVY